MTVMENMLQAHSGIQAVFAANDEMALGAIEAIKAGRMAGTIAQQPALIGAAGVENAVKLISGLGIHKSVPVEVTLITAENAG